MTDCDNSEIRDMLPDLVFGTLSAADASTVRLHLRACESCSDEIELLRVVKSVRPRAVAIDTAKIVAALPKPASQSPLRLVKGRSDEVVTTAFRGQGLWKIAAAVMIAAVGSWAGFQYLTGTGGGTSASATVATAVGTPDRGLSSPNTRDSGEMVIASSNGLGDRSGAASDGAAQAGRSNTGRTNSSMAALAVGDLSLYTDADLARMLDRLEKWDGATSAQSPVSVPILPVTERGSL